MNHLLGFYNCNKYEKIIDYDFSLYFLNFPEQKIDFCENYIFINYNNLKQEIFNYIKKVYNYVDYITFIDYEKFNKKLFFFPKCEMLFGYINKAYCNKDKEFFAMYYDFHYLTINCKNLKDYYFDDMLPYKIGNVNFDYFSYFMHKNYSKCIMLQRKNVLFENIFNLEI